MRRSRFGLAASALALALTLVVAAPAAAAAPLAENPGVVAAIRLYEIWVGEQMAYRHQPGLSVGVVYGGELVWGRGFGWSDLEGQRPATTATIYRLGSISKTFTATAVLLLRDEGKMRLDEPVATYLPWFRPVNPFAASGAEITVRQLLTHTSGLPRESAFPYWTDREFPTRDQLVEALGSQELVFEPGTGYQYSNLGIAVAGELAATVAGVSYAELVRTRILEPLGMASTFVAAPQSDPTRLATGYLISRAGGTRPLAPGTDARALTPAANLSSTVEDLALYLAAHLSHSASGKSALLRPATLREMHRVHWLSSSWSNGRGLGFSVWRQGDRTLVGHGGWVAGHRSQIAFDPGAGIGVIVLTNSDEGGPGVYVEQALEILAPAIEKAVAPPPAKVLEVDVARYTGAFHNPWGEVSEFLVLDGRLVIYDHSYPPTDEPLGSITRLVADGEHAFRKERSHGTGDPVVFELRPDGRVARVKVGENYLFPADCGRIGPDLQCTWQAGE